MKPVTAWFLLFIVLSQWIGGVLCFQVSYYYQIRHHMNALEQLIAERVQERIGAAGAVKMLDENALMPKGAYYNDFIFSEKVEGQTVYFELTDETSTVSVEKVTLHHTPVSDTGKSILIKSIIQESILPESANIPNPVVQHQALISFLLHKPAKPTLAVLCPPPNVNLPA